VISVGSGALITASGMMTKLASASHSAILLAARTVIVSTINLDVRKVVRRLRRLRPAVIVVTVSAQTQSLAAVVRPIALHQLLLARRRPSTLTVRTIPVTQVAVPMDVIMVRIIAP
jgi:Ni2+-binding GTPase involved in maturation of urease and hydrogenase